MIRQAGVDGEGAALVTAGATVVADRIVKLYTDRFVRQADAMMMDTVIQRKAAIREEVQTELSAERVVTDIAAGKRPTVAMIHLAMASNLLRRLT